MSSRDGIPRPLLVLTALVLAYVLIRVTGVGEWLEVERMRLWVADLGPLAPLAFLALFVAGVTLQIPGLIFVLATPALFSAPVAVTISVVGGNLATSANFAVVRAMGGKPHNPEPGSRLDRAFRQLTTRPVRAVAVIRLVGLMFPPLTAALAITPLRARHHALGTALGLSPALGVIVAVEALVLR